jgi:HD superfamily phosphodiesterase
MDRSKMTEKTVDWSKFIHQLFQIAEPYLAVRGDMLHAQVSHDYALHLIKQEGGNKKIIEPAIILHDVGWSRLKPRQIAAAYGQNADGKEAIRLNRIHELEGAAVARQILVSLEFDPLLIDKITVIIERHDSGSNAHSPEERVIKDADKLWRYSKIGFWNEVERQRLHPKEFYAFLASRYISWLFTQTAIELAEKELGRRINEID